MVKDKKTLKRWLSKWVFSNSGSVLMITAVSCHILFYTDCLWCFGKATETHTWVIEKTGIQQLICSVSITMSQEAKCLCVCVSARVHVQAHLHLSMFGCLNMCVCVFVCRWQLQPQTDWHLAVAVVLTAELTALIRTHPNQKETTPVHCSWAQPRKGWGGGGRRGRMEERKTQSEVWMKAGSERDGGLVIRSRWKEWWGQREVEGERWRERGGEEEFRHR